MCVDVSLARSESLQFESEEAMSLLVCRGLHSEWVRVCVGVSLARSESLQFEPMEAMSLLVCLGPEPQP